MDTFGMEDSTRECQFVRGVLFAPSSSSHVIPLLQDVYQADGAHSQFGKYILYLAYGTNANGHMSAISFGLLFEMRIRGIGRPSEHFADRCGAAQTDTAQISARRNRRGSCRAA